jgi:coenzyme PQQ precursor peptide PqqA
LREIRRSGKALALLACLTYVGSISAFSPARVISGRLHRSARADILLRPGEYDRSVAMTWETPCAIEWRFGFEITSYVANR